MSRYGGLDELDIPEVDIFLIGDYRKINTGKGYYVVNNGIDAFYAVKLFAIKSAAEIATKEVYDNGDERNYGKTRKSFEEQGNKQTGLRDDSVELRYGRATSEDDRGRGIVKESEQELYSGEGSSDSGPGLKLSDRDTEPVSNRDMGG